MPQQKVVFDSSIHRIEGARTHFLKDAGSFHLLMCVFQKSFLLKYIFCILKFYMIITKKTII
jgi:hypothetical protein